MRKNKPCKHQRIWDDKQMLTQRKVCTNKNKNGFSDIEFFYDITSKKNFLFCDNCRKNNKMVN